MRAVKVHQNEKYAVSLHHCTTPFCNQRSHAVFVYCPEGIAHVVLVFPEMTSLNRISAAYRKAQMVSEEDGGLRRGRNVPCK